jgi:uncharacterized protein (DUF1697 family)
MKVYISFLRGVNMTGHNSIKMAELTRLFVNMGFSDSVTYIQSGNVIFSSDKEMTDSEIEILVEEAIRKKYSYNVRAIVRTKNELEKIIAGNPFLNEMVYHPSKTAAVIFLKDHPDIEQINRVQNINFPPDRFIINGSEIYILCPDGFGRTKLYTNFFESKMGVVGTARNCKSIAAIFDIAENLGKM